MNAEKINLTFETHIGKEARKILDDLAELRIEVFREYPYLYDGNIDYERKYLGRYFSSKNSFLHLARHDGELIGATTAIPLIDEDPMVKDAFGNFKDYPLDSVFYFGESLVRAAYRGNKLGERFFNEREAFAIRFPSIRFTTFCAVIRDPNDPRKPAGYRSPESLWRRRGYSAVENLKTHFEWKELGEKQMGKREMQFWLRPL